MSNAELDMGAATHPYREHRQWDVLGSACPARQPTIRSKSWAALVRCVGKLI
jgi:hypothetical protein